MIFSTDEYCECLFLRGEEVFSGDGETFDLIASAVGDILLSEIPIGIQVQLCDYVHGSSSRDLYTRSPHAVFENSTAHGLVAHLSTPFFPPTDDTTGDALLSYFNDTIDSGRRSLEPLRKAVRLIDVKDAVYDDIAYLSYIITMYDQTFSDAEKFVSEIDSRVTNSYDTPSLFVCHASEDKPFVEKLVTELDRRAMFAWYDKREILVGDSIVEKINTGLSNADFLIAVLSPRSVSKPWVVREMSSSLMRQLSNREIKILPILLEKCELPTLLTDIKYANFCASFDFGFNELMTSIRCRTFA